MSFGQGGPFDGPGGGTPDWDALADESEARARRKRWMMIGGGAVATLAIAGIVAAAVMNSSSPGGKPTDRSTASGQSAAPDDKPSFPDVSVPPPPNPRDYISDPRKDTAPLTPATLFPQKSMVVGEHSYPQTATDSSTDCTAAAQGALVSSLTHNGCKQLLRATYAKDGVAVTVGVAVFDSPAKATAVMNDSKPNLMPLSGGGVPANFCQGTKCRMTTNATGRYAYFTIAGYTNGQDVNASDTKAQQINRDGGSYAFAQIAQRGRDQAAKAAEKQLQDARRKAGKS
ncbi:membrane protein [Streptomyces sp. CT34]|uniref:membrane protein n=1 Tax=Streptomyces sp. CT34 TaxID=1553907 RepID=UPI0005BE8AA1|nr:membrane protein [Streptomyces sp. CT34]